MEPTSRADRIVWFFWQRDRDDTVQRLKDSQRQSESSHLSLVIAERLVDALEGRMGTADHVRTFGCPATARRQYRQPPDGEGRPRQTGRAKHPGS